MTLSELQTWAATQLNADPWLVERQVAFTAENSGDLATAVDEAVNRLGIAGVVSTPDFTSESEDAAGAAGPASLSLIVYEQETPNRARPGYCTALDAAGRAFTIARSWPGAVPRTIRQRPAGPGGIVAETVVIIHFIHD